MIIKTELLQKPCSRIIGILDQNVLSAITEVVELKSVNGKLELAVTNREYFVKIRIDTPAEASFHATVNANQFLKLISKVTSDTIELVTDDNSLTINCNGVYKLPLVYEGDKLIELPPIEMDTEVESCTISSGKLNTIVDFNSKELDKGLISKPVQRLYYLDSEGCITFTSGACVNSFNTNLKSQLLLEDRIVRLFKLFKTTDTDVKVTVGHKSVSAEMTSTVVRFETEDIYISAILTNDDSLLQKYPVSSIRNRVSEQYPYHITLDKSAVLQALDRLMIFESNDSYADLIKVSFTPDSIILSDYNNTNKEEVTYAGDSKPATSYEILIDSKDFSKTLSSCTGHIVELNFGNDQAILIIEGNIRWVIPQCYEVQS